MVNLPLTVWRPTSGNGEAIQSNNSAISTQNSTIIATQDGRGLQVQPGAYTKLPGTVWITSEGE